MKISAMLKNGAGRNQITVTTEGHSKEIQIPARDTGKGSSVNGGELLFLSLATCFCNDIYREAAKRKLTIESVDVIVKGEFGKEGEPARNICYEAQVSAPGSTPAEIEKFLQEVDAVAEIQNTLRAGINVTLNLKK